MPQPTEEIWKNSAAKYKELWNFLNCVGALDGNHITIQCPVNGGSEFYNYKRSHSIVLLVLVDVEYKFIAIDVGSYGRNSDCSIFYKSNFGKKLERNNFSLPPATPFWKTVNLSHMLLLVMKCFR